MNAVEINNLTKIFKLYKKSYHRLLEEFTPLKKKYHKPFYALDDISLSIPKGQRIGIIGRNGSGKSTLLKLICGITSPNSGTITVNGNISALLELGSAFSPYYTGIENIYFYGMVLGFSQEVMDAKLNDIAEFSELGEFLDQPLRTYSSGMKAKLAFSVAVNIDPEILILDEVLSVGDQLFKDKCHLKLQDLWSEGRTIIFVSHNMGSIVDFCNRAIWLHKGKILADGDPEFVIAKYSELKSKRLNKVL